jgi:hypothetical protein
MTISEWDERFFWIQLNLFHSTMRAWQRWNGTSMCLCEVRYRAADRGPGREQTVAG